MLRIAPFTCAFIFLAGGCGSPSAMPPFTSFAPIPPDSVASPRTVPPGSASSAAPTAVTQPPLSITPTDLRALPADALPDVVVYVQSCEFQEGVSGSAVIEVTNRGPAKMSVATLSRYVREVAQRPGIPQEPVREHRYDPVSAEHTQIIVHSVVPSGSESKIVGLAGPQFERVVRIAAAETGLIRVALPAHLVARGKCELQVILRKPDRSELRSHPVTITCTAPVANRGNKD